MNVQRCADCGNSPKNAFVEAIAIALLSGDADTLRRSLAPDAILDIVGSSVARGAVAITACATGAPPRETLVVESVVSHGRAGAASGVTIRGGAPMGFCLMMRFASAKADLVASMKLYAPAPVL